MADLSPIQENMLAWDILCAAPFERSDDCDWYPVTFFTPDCLMTVACFHESNIVDMIEYGHNLLRLFQGRGISPNLERVEFKNCPVDIADCKVYIIGNSKGQDLYWLMTTSGNVVREYAIGTMDSLFVPNLNSNIGG